MSNTLGTIAIGLRAPIIRSGDNLVSVVVEAIKKSQKENALVLGDKDIICVTEALLARSQGNYASVDNIASDIKVRLGENETIGLVFPILSRNRFALLLKGIAKAAKKLIVQLSYPSDEVGNHIISLEKLDEKGIDIYKDSFTMEEFTKLFPDTKHPFTGINYLEFYKSISSNIEIILSNDPKEILKYTKSVVCADIHSRERTKKILLKNGAKKVVSLCEVLTESVDGSGYHKDYGLLGSNMASENTVKLFPRDAQKFAEDLQAALIKEFKVDLECMIYGDGAFKDPIGGIWELADPVVSPGFTKGLMGQPNELKLKYIADNDIKELTGEDAESAVRSLIKKKKVEAVGNEALGTTPRRLVDLLGSLADLISGSGDKGTPIVLVQNYFKNYSD